MRLYYEGVDITDDINIVSAVHRDISGGRCDCLDIALDHAQAWYRWKPQINDSIMMTHNGYFTGMLFLDTIAPPENGRYRILATSIKRSARKKQWYCYKNSTIKEIFELCAAQCGMGSKLYGIDENIRYPFMLRRNENCMTFLERLASWQGAVMKVYSGKFTAIDIATAQSLEAGMIMEVNADQDNAEYLRREGIKYASVSVKTLFDTVYARDPNAVDGDTVSIAGIPAHDVATAGRWARGILLRNNRRAEELRISTEFNANYTAMGRVNIVGGTDADGKWLVDEVEHDFTKDTSTVKLLRCVEGIV